MESFISRQELAKQQRRYRAATWVFRGLAAGMLALFVILCLSIRTVNMRVMTWTMIISMTLLGWIWIAVYFLAVRPARAKAGHLEMLCDGTPEAFEGILRLSAQAVQVPKSIRVRRVTLEGEQGPNPVAAPETKRLNLDDSLAGRMPPEGSRVRVQAVNDYITGVEVLEKGAGESAARAAEGLRPALRRTAALAIPCVLWTMAVVIIGGFIFNRLTDTDPGHKIAVYADCGIRKAEELAGRLEEGMADPVRMVQVRPFTYETFGTREIESGDLYIVSASKAEGLRDWFAPLPEDMRDGENLLEIDGVPYGVPVYSRKTWDVSAAAYFDYDPEETYYLVFSAASLHLSGNEGATDNQARDAADAILNMR